MAESTWDELERPLIERACEAEEAGRGLKVTAGPELLAAKRLVDAGYLAGSVSSSWGSRVDRVDVFGVTAKGLQEIGRWPAPSNPVDQFLAAISAAIESAPTEEERTRLESIQKTARELGVNTVASIVAALVMKHTGI